MDDKEARTSLSRWNVLAKQSPKAFRATGTQITRIIRLKGEVLPRLALKIRVTARRCVILTSIPLPLVNNHDTSEFPLFDDPDDLITFKLLAKVVF